MANRVFAIALLGALGLPVPAGAVPGGGLIPSFEGGGPPAVTNVVVTVCNGSEGCFQSRGPFVLRRYPDGTRIEPTYGYAPSYGYYGRPDYTNPNSFWYRW